MSSCGSGSGRVLRSANQALSRALQTASASSGQDVLSGVQAHTPAAIYKFNPDVFVSHALGSWVYATDGRKLLDMATGIGATSTGHCHPRVVSAVREQAGKVVHAQQNVFGAHEAMAQLYDRLGRVLPPHLDSYVLVNSGAEGVENAIKIARAATGKQNVIAFDGGFHGRTLGTMALTSSKVIYRQRFGPFMPGVTIAPYPYCLHCKAQVAVGHSGYPAPGAPGEVKCCGGPLESLEWILKQQCHPDDTAAIVLEPILGEGGFLLPPPGFMPALRELCTAHNIMLIADEVQAGVGRTGLWWGHQHFLPGTSGTSSSSSSASGGGGVCGYRPPSSGPDLLVFAKGIASGYPLAGVAAPSGLMGADKMAPGTLGGTYGGNAVACAAAVATIDVINEERLCDNARDRGAQLSAGLVELSRRVPGINDVRGRGLMVGVEFGGEGPAGNRSAPAPKGVAGAIIKACAARGMLLLTAGPREAVRFLPPLTVSASEIDQALDVFGQACAEVLPAAYSGAGSKH